MAAGAGRRKRRKGPPAFYEILMSGEPNRNRKLTASSGTKPQRKEAIMLDLAFVVLGFAVIAVMALYAVALRQL